MRAVRSVGLVCIMFLTFSILMAGCRGSGSPPRSASRPEIGKAALGFVLQELRSGRSIRFPDAFKGRAVALTFFSGG